ncbi:MAG: nucleotide exchange factor GrpE [Patescibacteria group bacterium]
MTDENKNSGQTQTAAGAQDEAEKLQADLAAANQKIQDLTETAKRALADLQNYRKRVEKERSDFAAFANVTILLELLPILDNFTRAFSQVPQEIQKTEWFKGVLQIEQQLVALVKRKGITEMPSTVGKKLDIKIHEPIMTGPGEKDTIVEEFEKGYLIGEKILRPAKVKVGDGTAPPSLSEEEPSALHNPGLE